MQAVEAKSEASPPVTVEETNEKADVEQQQEHQQGNDERLAHPLLQVVLQTH